VALDEERYKEPKNRPKKGDYLLDNITGDLFYFNQYKSKWI